jgi:3-hydroxybutyryl-CoA dehydrogenase
MNIAHATIGVIGAGVMGRGVSQNLAQSGHRVLLVDNDVRALGLAKGAIHRGLRLQRMLRKSPGGKSISDITANVSLATDLSVLETADFIIENITEQWESKKSVYAAIDRICRPQCVFAANTSAIPISRIAAVTGRPSKMIGIHFMNPVPLKDTVEVIRTQQTSQETLDVTVALLGTMGKACVVVNDAAGFVSNRVLMLMVNEAIFLLQDGVATAEDVDRIFKSCMGHTMGPLETADLIGLDTILYTLHVLDQSYGGEKFKPCPKLEQMVADGLYGRKSGRGFYQYSESM